MNLDEAKKHFERARVTVGLASPEWARMFDQNVKRPQVVARDELTGQFTPIATIARGCPSDDEEILCNALDWLRALLLLNDEAFKIIRERNRQIAELQAKLDNRARAADFAAECAMKCDDPLFRRYMAEVHQADTSDTTRMISRLRSVLMIKSRGELNADPQAAERWKDLRGRFEAWKRDYQPARGAAR